uniref:Ribosome hibernation promoting factor n=1 Tax=candidate division CPR3 bacterium TaxID=2268181 RepID=A0A7C4R5I1_UNCC3
MTINITGKNIDLTDPIKAYIEEKMQKLDRYLTDIEPVVLDIRIETNKGKGEPWQKIEATLSIPNLIIRSEEIGQDVYEVADIVQEKLERKIRDNKNRILDLRKDTNKENDASLGYVDTKELEKVVKRKKFDLGRSITEDEAISRMELLGHDFYIFQDSLTNQQKVVYKRKDGGYGVIESK